LISELEIGENSRKIQNFDRKIKNLSMLNKTPKIMARIYHQRKALKI
jgi:hypothetical protein